MWKLLINITHLGVFLLLIGQIEQPIIHRGLKNKLSITRKYLKLECNV